MHNFINPQLQKKAKLYEKKKDILHLTRVFISGTYLLLFYIFGISKYISTLVNRFSMPLAIALYFLFFTPLILILFILSYYSDYAIEKRFGLSSQSIKSWISDHIKGLLLSVILGYPFLLLLFFLFAHVPYYWWIFGVLSMFIFQLFILIIFPVLIFPLFFKQKPIENEELANKIYFLFNKIKMRIKGIYSFNMSLKTKKENALLAGLWKTRRILIADTLLNNRNNEEILVVLAHEIGHHEKKHTLKLALIQFFTSFALFYALNRVMNLFQGFPENFQSTLALFPIFVLILGLISFPIRIIINAYSRSKEKEADSFAVEKTNNKEAFIALMAGLANTNLVVAYPKKFKVLLTYTHPPIGQRIDNAQKYRG